MNTETRIQIVSAALIVIFSLSRKCQVIFNHFMKLKDVGETTASMLYVTLGDGTQFVNGLQALAFIGVTPKQYSRGSKVMMVGIDKVGGAKELRSIL